MKKTVLLIDDDDMLRVALARGLRAVEFNVLTANSADVGFEILGKIKPDAIVLDRMMTGMDGLSFLKKLRAAGNLTPILMLTAMSGPENTIDGLSSGANDYLTKPFQIRELVLRLNNIIPNLIENVDALPCGLIFKDGEFFINTELEKPPKVIILSNEEKNLLLNLVSPVGISVSAAPMVAKRLRTKLNDVSFNIDIITVRGHGYKLINKI